jgi:hypothetical protein
MAGPPSLAKKRLSDPRGDHSQTRKKPVKNAWGGVNKEHEMTRSCLIFCVVLSWGGRLPAQEWRSLFDGQTFAGWEGNQDIFRIEDGAIVGGSLKAPVSRNEFLCTKAPYEDFELRLKVRVRGEGANAGIQFRSQRIPNHHEVSGYQADVGAGWWGKLYDESRRNRVLAEPPESAQGTKHVRPDDWNEYRIRCEANRIQLWLNGVQTVDYTETDAQIPRRGVIGLQIHGGPACEAWYRDIEIRMLGEKE